MYKMRAVIKNVNLRTEIAGDERHGAFDLKIETPLTAELHKWLCKRTENSINLTTLANCGLDSVKYQAEYENVRIGIGVTPGELSFNGAKVNNIQAEFEGKQTLTFRIQAGMQVRGMIDDINDLTGEQIELSLEELQGDMLDNEQKESEQIPEKPKASTKKKSSKKKKKSDQTLHVAGRGTDNLTEAQIASRKQEQENLSKGSKGGLSEEDKEQEQINSMMNDLNLVQLAGDDVEDFAVLKEKHDNGRKFTENQVRLMAEIHAQYCKAA